MRQLYISRIKDLGIFLKKIVWTVFNPFTVQSMAWVGRYLNKAMCIAMEFFC